MFFCSGYNGINVSTKKNWDIDDILKHMQEVSQSEWLIESMIDIDYKTKGFKGFHQDKRLITHNTEG